MKKSEKTCGLFPVTREAATEPDSKARTIQTPQSPVLYLFNVC